MELFSLFLLLAFVIEDLNDKSSWGVDVGFVFITYKKYMTGEMM